MCKKKEVKMIKRPVAVAAEAACLGNGREPPASICEIVHIDFAITIAIYLPFYVLLIAGERRIAEVEGRKRTCGLGNAQ